MLNIQSVTAINMVNAQSAARAYQNMDGKIFVSTDMLAIEKTQQQTVSSILNRLNNIDNLAKDKNGSQSLPYAETKTSSERREYQPKEALSSESNGRLLNVYA